MNTIAKVDDSGVAPVKPSLFEKRWPFFGLLLVVFGAWAVAGFGVYHVSAIVTAQNLPIAGQFGDMFGAVNALFSGLAMAGVIYAVFMQRGELKLQRDALQAQREEMGKMVATQVRQLHISVQSLGIKPEDMSAVWDPASTAALTGPHSAYINLVISDWEMQHAEKLLTEAQVVVLLSKYLGGSPLFRKFWESARVHRKNMSDAGSDVGKKFHELAEAAYSAKKEKQA